MKGLVFAALILSGVSAAADSRTQARAHYEKASAAFALGRFADAAGEFERAFELKPDAALLYNAAQSHRMAGNKSRALLLYQNYLRVFGAHVSNTAEVKGHISELKRSIEQDEQARNAPPTVLAPPPPAPTLLAAPEPKAPPERPLVKKPWFWVTVVGAAAVVATGIALGVTLGHSTQDPTASQGTARGN
jgi:tetratricopeptide (TPR) repeat protein